MGKDLADAIVDIADGLDSIARGLRALLRHLHADAHRRAETPAAERPRACLKCGGPVTTIGMHHCDDCRAAVAPPAPPEPKAPRRREPTGTCRYCGDPLYNPKRRICNADACRRKRSADQVKASQRRKVEATISALAAAPSREFFGEAGTCRYCGAELTSHPGRPSTCCDSPDCRKKSKADSNRRAYLRRTGRGGEE